MVQLSALCPINDICLFYKLYLHCKTNHTTYILYSTVCVCVCVCVCSGTAEASKHWWRRGDTLFKWIQDNAPYIFKTKFPSLLRFIMTIDDRYKTS